MSPTSIPARLFGDALLDGWCGPIEQFVHTTDFSYLPTVERTAVRANGEDWSGYWRSAIAPLHVGGEFCERLPLTKAECRHRLCVVLAAGERWSKRDKMLGVSVSEQEALSAIQDNKPPSQWKREPAPCWHLLPSSEGGRLSDSYAQHAPALLACHALLVAAGKKGLLVGFHPWQYDTANCSWSRSFLFANVGTETHVHPHVTDDDPNHWLSSGPGWSLNGWHGNKLGKEVLDEGRKMADALCLVRGYALLDEDGSLRLPEISS